MANTKKLIMLCILFSFLLISSAYATRTVLVLNDLFIDFSVTSNNPYWINDSQIVHGIGRVNYENDGRYIMTNAKTYYAIIDGAFGNKVRDSWTRHVGTDFQKDVIEYYNERPQINLSQDLDLKNYWNERKKDMFGKK